MGIAIWYFVRSDSAFRAVPCTRVTAFIDGAAIIPACSDGFVHLVEVIVSLRDRRAADVVRIAYIKHRVLASGRIDHDQFWAMASVATEAAVGGVLSTRDSVGVVESGHRFAQRRFEHQNRWKPTEADVLKLSALVNRKAKCHIL